MVYAADFLEQTLCRRAKRKPQPHVLDPYFRDRHIMAEGIADALEVSAVAVRTWLSGRQIPIKRFETMLQDLKESIDRWEIKKGRKFDGRIFR